jgi:hypothetical protein
VVVFVGDGTSDRYAAHHADVVFAKGSLERWCREVGWPHRSWDRFAEIGAWTRAAFANGELPSAAADLERWHATHGRPARDFICGPEVWGDGRSAPRPADAERDGLVARAPSGEIGTTSSTRDS